jgi:hypothetical protein
VINNIPGPLNPADAAHDQLNASVWVVAKEGNVSGGVNL